MASDQRWRWRSGDVVRLLTSWISGTITLIVTDGLLPGLSADSLWLWAAVAVVAGIVGLVLRPLMVEISARLGWIAVLLVAFLGQALVMYAAFHIVPGVHASRGTAIVAAWVAAAVATLISWATTMGTDDGLVTALLGRDRLRRRHPVTVPDPEVDGIVFVQLDGVPFPVMRWAVQSGAVPNIRRWLGSGAYQLREWTVQLPCTTPASQQGILHGTTDRIPAFRWFDRELGRVLVANKPPDAVVIESRATTGRGLLADGGVSISNLFTGDAERALMTMSRVGAGRGSTQTRRAFAWFLSSPSGFLRSFSRTVAEIGKERWQARRQVRIDLDPRVHRGWTFALLRAVTNALLRDLNTALVAEEMRLGTRSIYVDYVDYDEIAHHAGVFRPESLAALEGLDRTLGSLLRLSEGAPRRYHLVALSDHGQSQGAVFADRFGVTLGDLCSALMDEEVGTFDAAVEGLGRVDSIAADVGPDGVGKLAANADARLTRAADSDHDEGENPVLVFGSGNLGLVYLRGSERLTLDELDRRWPRLVPGLAGHPGVSFVAGQDAEGTPWAIGPGGRHHLGTGEVEGEDPLGRFPEHAPRMLRHALSMAEAPDLYVNSMVDADTDEVAAFEGLVGSHGGFGGWQDRGMLLVPTEFAELLPDHIERADGMHECLVSMLESVGQRRSLHPVEPG